MSMLQLLDMDKNTATYMCTQPQCMHESNECTAFNLGFFGRGYDNGYIYYVNLEETDESACFQLEKVSVDGQIKESVGEIIRIDKMKGIPLESCGISGIFHRGYYYYVYVMGATLDESGFYNNNSNCLYRMPMDGSGEPELLMAMDTDFVIGAETMLAYGSYVYFCMADMELSGEIYRYNIESDQMEKMDIGTIATETYTVLDGCIIYKKNYSDKILYRYNPMDNTETVFSDMTNMVEGDSWELRQDGKYISVYYTSHPDKEIFLVFLNKDGTYAGKIVLDTNFEEDGYYGTILGGDEYLFYQKGENYELTYADKRQLEQGEIIHVEPFFK